MKKLYFNNTEVDFIDENYSLGGWYIPNEPNKNNNFIFMKKFGDNIILLTEKEFSVDNNLSKITYGWTYPKDFHGKLNQHISGSKLKKLEKFYQNNNISYIVFYIANIREYYVVSAI